MRSMDIDFLEKQSIPAVMSGIGPNARFDVAESGVLGLVTWPATLIAFGLFAGSAISRLAYLKKSQDDRQMRRDAPM